MQKIAPQRFRNISLTSGNVAPISASRTDLSPETSSKNE
jgi:hypothetical protein